MDYELPGLLAISTGMVLPGACDVVVLCKYCSQTAKMNVEMHFPHYNEITSVKGGWLSYIQLNCWTVGRLAEAQGLSGDAQASFRPCGGSFFRYTFPVATSISSTKVLNIYLSIY